jgi:catechol 2,3-dioxygenase
MTAGSRIDPRVDIGQAHLKVADLERALWFYCEVLGFAIRFPDRESLADALRRVRSAGIPLDGAADHGVSEALYLRDPDGNGVELYRDRPRGEWPRTASGVLAMYTRPLDLVGLLSSMW